MPIVNINCKMCDDKRLISSKFKETLPNDSESASVQISWKFRQELSMESGFYWLHMKAEPFLRFLYMNIIK